MGSEMCIRDSDAIVLELKSRLAGLSQVVDIRNAGMMIAIELDTACAELVAKAADIGLIINVTGGNRIRLLPPLNLSEDDVELLLNKLCPLIQEWEAS